VYPSLLAFGHAVNFWFSILAYAVANFAGRSRCGPAAVGIYERSWPRFWRPAGVPADSSLPVIGLIVSVNTLRAGPRLHLFTIVRSTKAEVERRRHES